MRKKIAIFVLRNSQLKVFLPIIKEMLCSGKITPVLITTCTMNSGIKKLQDYNPRFNPFHDKMEVHYINYFDELPVVMEKLKIKVLISNLIIPLLSNLDYNNTSRSNLLSTLKEKGMKYIYLQYCFDLVAILPQLFSFDTLNLVDGFFCQSQYWLEEMLNALREQFNLIEEELSKIRSRCYVVGSPELDPVTDLDKQAILNKYGIGRDGRRIIFFDPVENVNFIPNFFYKYHFRMFGSARDKALRMLKNLIIDLRTSPRSVWKFPFYFTELALRYRKTPDYQTFFSELRRFSKENNYLLICKSREKFNDPDFVKSGCDLFSYDLSYFPFTLLELLFISDLYIGFSGTALIEAVYCGLPVLAFHVYPVKFQFGHYGGSVYEYIEQCVNTPGDWLNYPGVSRVHRLYDQKIDFSELVGSLKFNPASRRDYVEKFVGFSDGKSSKRVLEVLETWFP